jgi:hypothetical protein
MRGFHDCNPRRGRSCTPAFRRVKATVPGSTDISAPMVAKEEPDRYAATTFSMSSGRMPRCRRVTPWRSSISETVSRLTPKMVADGDGIR